MLSDQCVATVSAVNHNRDEQDERTDRVQERDEIRREELAERAARGGELASERDLAEREREERRES